MASIRRLSKSPFYFANITLPDGTRTTRSTKVTDRRVAKKIASGWQDAADKARRGKLVESQARGVLNDILASVGEDELSGDTTEAFLRQWLTRKTNAGTAKRYARAVDLFLALLGNKAKAPLSAITHKEILALLEARIKTGAAPKTISVDVKVLNTAFNLARKLGLVLSNPVEKALALHPIEVESSQRECFTAEQVKALLDTAEGDWRTVVMLGFYTGARLSDCANMRWDNVDLAQGVIDYQPQKTRRQAKRVVVPIHPVLLTRLEALAATDEPQEYLCPSVARKPTGGKNGLSDGFNRLMRKAGIDAQAEPGKGVRRFSALSFHSLRHSFNSTLANGGIDQETRMRLAGHSSVAVNDGYTHLELTRLKAAIERLPRLALVADSY